MHQLRPAEAREFAAEHDAQWLDVREPWEYELVHLPDAILIPLQSLPGRVAEMKRDRPVIVYCHHGMRSLMAAQWLEQMGLETVCNLAGGIDAWATELDSSLPRY